MSESVEEQAIKEASKQANMHILAYSIQLISDYKSSIFNRLSYNFGPFLLYYLCNQLCKSEENQNVFKNYQSIFNQLKP